MRRGVTLIELLITMAIMAIISAAILGTASAAMESARRSRTQSLINKISELIIEQLATYEVRRVPLRPDIERDINAIGTPDPTDLKNTADRARMRGEMMADTRLLGLRELIKMEMPDTVEDVQHIPLVLAERPSASMGYFRRYTPAMSKDHDSAECLYMTVMAMTGDGEARTLFSKQDIGDADEDGAPEFVDGWGQPIRWMRWAPGLVSDLQPVDANGNRISRDITDPFSRDVQPTATSSLTPLGSYPASIRDIYKANIRDRLTAANGPANKGAFRLVPLIYSVGPDGDSAVQIPSDPTKRPLDPFQILDNGAQPGAPAVGQESLNKDNITNHLTEY